MLRKWSMLAGFAALLTAAPAMAFGVAPSATKADDNNANGIEYPAPASLAIAAPQIAAGPTNLPNLPSPPSNCNVAGCTLRFTGAQLVAAAEAAIAQRDFANAAPLVEALGQAPDYKFQHRFLKGFIAAETGDIAAAETAFRKILVDDPKQTRVRLELARVLLQKGQEGAANYHFRLAQQDKDLPEEIRQTVSSIRSIIRSKRKWNLNFDFGIAPDTNINSATAAETVNINFGPTQVPLTLNDDARKKSGIGQTAGLSAGLRLKASEALAFIIDTDFRAVNYEGKAADNFQFQLGAGPELRLSPSASLSVQAIGEKRWYGGQRANTDFGAQVAFQKVLDAGQRIAIAVDGRNTTSHFSDAYSGWQVGSNVTYERVIMRSFIASASLFARRDYLESDAFSNVSYGVNLGIGGELPFGINGGVSASVSQSEFDAPQLIYSTDNRKDLRLFTRAYAGLRNVKLLGFSPSAEYNFSQVRSNYELYRSSRHRFNFKLARYF